MFSAADNPRGDGWWPAASRSRNVYFDQRAAFGAARDDGFPVQGAHALAHPGDAMREQIRSSCASTGSAACVGRPTTLESARRRSIAKPCRRTVRTAGKRDPWNFAFNETAWIVAMGTAMLQRRCAHLRTCIRRPP